MQPNKRPSQKQMLAACETFNALHKVGDPVRYWTGLREGDGKVGVIAHPAQIMSGHTAVIYVQGAGSVALSHVQGGAA